MAIASPPSTTDPAPRRPWRLDENTRWVLGLNAPALILVITLVAYPVVYSFWNSLHFYVLRRPDDIRFIGLENYAYLLTNSDFWASMRITVIFGIGTVLATIVVGMSIALLFNESFRGRGLARAMLLIPWAIPGVVNGLMWRGLLGKYGGINSLLTGANELSLFGMQPLSWLPPEQTWLGDARFALFATGLAAVWKQVPFAAIIFLASLQAIPQELNQAAQVDGASAWRRFRYVTLPWLLHPLLIVAIFQTMNAFRAFDIIFTLTGGGPGRATTVIAWRTYIEAFRFLNFGTANAYSYLIAIITLTLTVIYIRALYRRGMVQA